MKYEVLKILFFEFLEFFFPSTGIWNEIHNWNKEDILQDCVKSQHTHTSLFCYKDPKIKEMIWSIKFRGSKHFAKIFGELLWKKLKDKRGVLIPIPIHPKRRKERGFNQCEWICEEILKHDVCHRLKYEPHILERLVHSEQQSHSNKEERIKNIKGVFSVTRNISGEDVILVDDVITTGATINEVQQLLLKAGANSVSIYTIAH